MRGNRSIPVSCRARPRRAAPQAGTATKIEDIESAAGRDLRPPWMAELRKTQEQFFRLRQQRAQRLWHPVLQGRGQVLVVLSRIAVEQCRDLVRRSAGRRGFAAQGREFVGGLAEVGPQAHGLAETGERLVAPPQRLQHHAAILVRLGKPRTRAQRGAIAGLRLCGPVLVGEQRAKVVVRLRMVNEASFTIERQRAPDVRGRARKITGRLGNQAEQMQGIRVRRIAREDFAIQ